MADEITCTSNLNVRSGTSQIYQSQGGSFRADMGTVKGPSPGALSVPKAGRNVYFNELTQPGIAFIKAHPDNEGYIQVGIFDPQSLVSYFLLELLPGEAYPIRFNRNLQEQFSGSGTGTTGPENYLRLKAEKDRANGTYNILTIEAFESAGDT